MILISDTIHHRIEVLAGDEELRHLDVPKHKPQAILELVANSLGALPPSVSTLPVAKTGSTDCFQLRDILTWDFDLIIPALCMVPFCKRRDLYVDCSGLYEHGAKRSETKLQNSGG